MKIEIEIDEALVTKAVIDKLVERFEYQVRLDVEQAVKDSIRVTLQNKAREHVTEILKDFRLPDGRTFKEYLEQILLRRDNQPVPMTWREQPKLFKIIEDRLWRDTEQLFREIAQPVLEEYKTKLRANFAQRLESFLRG